MKNKLIALFTAVIILFSGFGGLSSATAAPLPSAPSKSRVFKDVPRSHIFYKEIQWMRDNGFANGWGDNTYRPNESIKRDAVMVFFYRMAGSPEVDMRFDPAFTDVPKSHVFYKEIQWAYLNGITTGWEMKDGTRQFRPNEPIKRDAMAAFLYRMNGPEPIYFYYNFDDISEKKPFYWEMRWMQQKGIANGWTNGKSTTYRPYSNTQRDAMAAFLYRADRAGVFNGWR